jgi:hypothetical protein
LSSPVFWQAHSLETGFSGAGLVQILRKGRTESFMTAIYFEERKRREKEIEKGIKVLLAEMRT